MPSRRSYLVQILMVSLFWNCVWPLSNAYHQILSNLSTRPLSLWAFRLIYVNRGGGFEAESGTHRCSRGAKVFCCDAGDWKGVIAGCHWTKWYDHLPYST